MYIFHLRNIDHSAGDVRDGLERDKTKKRNPVGRLLLTSELKIMVAKTGAVWKGETGIKDKN